MVSKILEQGMSRRITNALAYYSAILLKVYGIVLELVETGTKRSRPLKIKSS
jgi:hypothetical protein